mgnify:FL=1
MISNEDSIVLVVVGGASRQAANDSLLLTHCFDLSDGASHALKHRNILFCLAAGDDASLAVETGVVGHVVGETTPVMTFM